MVTYMGHKREHEPGSNYFMPGRRKTRSPGHVDRWLLAYAIMVLQGLASAIPWNVYITETEYFNLRAHQPPTQQLLADNLETIELLVSQFANVIGFALYLPLQDAMSMDSQVLHPQVLTLIVMILAVAMTLSQQWSGTFIIWLALGSQAVLGVTNATIMGGVMAMASWLPPPYVQGMSMGMGVGCVGVAAMSFFTLWATPRTAHVPSAAEVAPAAFAYFTGSAAVLAISIVGYLLFFYLPYVQHHSMPPGFSKPPYQMPPGSADDLTHEQPAAAQHCIISPSASLPIPTPSQDARSGEDSRHTAASRSRKERRESASFLRTKSLSQRSRHGSFPSSLERSSMLDSSPGAASLAPEASSCDLEIGLDHAARLERRADSATSLSTYTTGNAGSTGQHAGRPGADMLADDDSAMHVVVSHHLLLPQTPAVLPEEVPLLRPEQQDNEDEDLSLAGTLRKLFWWNLVAVLECAVSLAVFPGVTSAICSQYNEASVAPCHPHSRFGRFYGDLFVPFSFVLFNTSDLIGRVAASLPPWNKHPPAMALLVLYSLLRIPLVGALLLCKVTTPSPWLLPVVFRSDWFPMLFTVLVGITNGHIQTLVYAHSPQAVPRKVRDRCGPIVNFALTIGCTLGSIFSFVFISSLQKGRA